MGRKTIIIKITYWCIILALIGIFNGCQLATRIEGEYYLNQEKYNQGVQKFHEKLKQDSFNADANYYMARYLLALNRPEDAYPFIREAVALDFKNADYHFWLGVCHHGLNRPKEEQKSYLRAIEFNQRHVLAYLYLGHSYLENGQSTEALDAYDKVLVLQKDQSQAMYNRGLALNKLQRFPGEIAAWKDYLEVYPEGGWAIQAVDHLNARGNFDYRNFLIGYRRVPLRKFEFKGSTAILTDTTKSSMDVIGSILRINKKIALKIVGYKKGNKNLAKKRAGSVKDYLITNYPEIDSGRLAIGGMGSAEKAQTGWKIFYLDNSVNLITTKK